jgi:hypothetical protein
MTRSVHVEYRREGYALADAFRPQPGWGIERHTAEGDRIPPGTTDAELIGAARANTPEGYRLGRVYERIDGVERNLYYEPVCKLMNRAAIPPHGEGGEPI